MEYGKKKIYGKVYYKKCLIKNFKKLFRKTKIEKIRIKMMMELMMKMINIRTN
jgi:hypothetical protein